MKKLYIALNIVLIISICAIGFYVFNIMPYEIKQKNIEKTYICLPSWINVALLIVIVLSILLSVILRRAKRVK